MRVVVAQNCDIHFFLVHVHGLIRVQHSRAYIPWGCLQVCHKKNHFQVTVSATIGDGIPTYVVPYGFDNTEANRLIVDGLEIHM